ncbi:MAG TPA: bifunctional serine/threonine-protein kinase/formylglycine-generating enzyme family protein [Gemmataceae bacterium]|nr:bifunctional serine/threonine-protein kinase/formylglycine-generating enzyme family protein [Gemmataceae bacterium]
MLNPVSLPEQFGRYRIIRKLGGGGMGTVYLAQDTELGRKVALKVPHFTADDTVAIERFKREARIAAGIEHPNLCPVYDVGNVSGTHYLTMPYIEGRQLSRWLKEETVWEPETAAELVRKLALALGVMHERGVMHRDLKPSNVLVQASGEPILVDFGLARSFDGKSQTLTETGERLGTPAYMSPEQVLGDAKKIGPPTDIYSLGMILFELVTGKLPFTGPPMAMYGQILHAKLPPPSSFRPGLDGQIDAICLKALAKLAEERFSSMSAFAEALSVYIARLPVPAAVPVGGPEPAPPPATVPAIATTPDEPELIEEFRLACPRCKRQLRVPPQYQGKRMKCPRCGASLGTATAPRPAAPPARTTPVAPAPTVPVGPSPAPPAERETAANSAVDTATTPPWRQRLLRNPVPLTAAGAGVLLVVVLLIVLLGRSGRSRSDGNDPEDRKKGGAGEEITLELTPEKSVYQLIAGQSAKVRIRVKRDRVKGPIELKLESAPPGLRDREGLIGTGKEVGELEIETEAGAPSINTELTILASAEGGRGKTSVRLGVDPANLNKNEQNSIGMKFVLVRGGPFKMGSPKSEPGHEDNEPQHDVGILCSFHLGAYEVTQAQYQAVMGTNPSFFNAGRGGGPNHPVEMVSYQDALEFCRKLSALPEEVKAGRSYRLPTQAEWEYACRARTTTPTHYGAKISPDDANFDGTEPYNNSPRKAGVGATTPVGQYKPNDWGLFDMHGNVWEWCSDWFQEDYSTKSPPTDPKGPNPREADRPITTCVIRGGSWYDYGERCRSACRGSRDPDSRSERVGFRVVLILGAKRP